MLEEDEKYYDDCVSSRRMQDLNSCWCRLCVFSHLPTIHHNNYCDLL